METNTNKPTEKKVEEKPVVEQADAKTIEKEEIVVEAADDNTKVTSTEKAESDGVIDEEATDNDVSEALSEGEFSLDEVDEQENFVIPSEQGIKCRCVSMEYDDDKDMLRLRFEQKLGNNEVRVAPLIIFNPLEVGKATKPEKARKDNIARVLHVLGAFCPPDKYDDMKKVRFNNFKELYTRMSAFIVGFENIDAKIMVGYNNGSLLNFPAYGSCISTAYKPYALKFDSNYLSLLPVQKTKKKGAGISLDSGNDEEQAEYLEM